MITTAAVSVTDNAIKNLSALKSEIFPLMKPHPVPQSDSRTKGFIIQFKKETAHTFFQHLPLLYDLIHPQLYDDREYILAVNQTPPTCTDSFAMRPHIDRKWEEGEFDSASPLFTTVMFVDFPAGTIGGELVIFDECYEHHLQALDAIDRTNARHQLSAFQPLIVTPIPGRICRFPGHLPHAVLGYTSPENEIWRLSIILAEFS